MQKIAFMKDAFNSNNFICHTGRFVQQGNVAAAESNVIEKAKKGGAKSAGFN